MYDSVSALYFLNVIIKLLNLWQITDTLQATVKAIKTRGWRGTVGGARLAG